MKTDIEIAQEAKMKPIVDIAASLGLADEDVIPYGRYKAKVNHRLIHKASKQGKLILVTAIRNPFDDTKKWPMAALPNGTIARITCMPEGCVYIPYGSKCRARITGITNQSTAVAVLQIFE